MSKPKIAVFVNKHFEVEPFMAAMMTLSATNKILPYPSILKIPSSGTNRMNDARAHYTFNNIDVEIWCIEDLMSANVSGSNSEEKYKVLPDYIRQISPDYVISVSTAESTVDVQTSEDKSVNGSVLFGCHYGMFNVHGMKDDPDPNSGSNLHLNDSDDTYVYASSNIHEAMFDLINTKVAGDAVKLFRPQYHAPAGHMICNADSGYLSVGVVNVTDYRAYDKADPAAYEAAKKNSPTKTPACIETTHGIVNMCTGNIPTLFVSPITDRYTHFADDVGNSGIQNYIAGYNAGIAVGTLLIQIDQQPKVIDN